MTWLELEPPHAPETPEELERMADWLRLAELLHERAPELLDGLGFPRRYEAVLEAFADATTPRDEPVLERELRIESLARLAALDAALSGQALDESLALTYEACRAGPRRLPDRNGFPVERVLRDLLSRLLHAQDLDCLIGVDVAREGVDLGLGAAALGRARATIVSAPRWCWVM